MEWIISGLIALFVCWCIYCIGANFDTYIEKGDFYYMNLFDKLSYITYQFVKWTMTVVAVVVFFMLLILTIKSVLFG